ncbi:hypothetical protein ECTW07945_3720, partial [Escherichia coli TW07945]
MKLSGYFIPPIFS